MRLLPVERVDALNAIDQGICLWWRAIGSARDFTRHTGDIEYVLSNDRNGPERIYHVRLDPADCERRIDEIAAGVRSGALPNGMILTPLCTPENIVELLRQRGFTVEDASPCMALELDGSMPTPVSEHIRVQAVEDVETLSSWARIVNDGLFGCELFTLAQFEDMFQLAGTALLIACWDGVPASACMTICCGDVSTLECVATLSEYRHKGLATAVVSQALASLAKQGVRIATLRSEVEAIPLYEKLGFREYCRRVVVSIV